MISNLVRQKRKAIIAQINLNKKVVDIETPPPMVYNSIGEEVKDTSKPWTINTIKCRIAYEQKSVDGQAEVASGFSTNLSRFILTDYKTPLQKGQRFENYEVGVVYPMTFMGEIIGYQAPLKESKG
jgi:hypothetical protein